MIVLVSSPLYLGPVSVASAAPEQQEATATFTFAQLGESDIIMNGPFDSSFISFSLPAYWTLQDGAEIQLVISSSFTGDTGEQEIQPDDFLDAELRVYFNGAIQQFIPLKNGNDIVYNVPIAPSDLISDNEDGSFEIYFELDASIDCDYPFYNSTAIISSTSQVIFPYAETAVNLDLRRLPWPIYQPDSQLPGSAVVVIPSVPSAEELQAALLVMASFGRMTNANLPLSLITLNELTDAVRNNSDLIFVGKPEGLSALSGVELPVSVAASGYVSPEMQTDDGVLQLAPSVWNKTKVILVVGGNTDPGVVKAAQAFSTSNIQVSNNIRYAIVAQVNPIESFGLLAPLTTSDYTLSSLGYSADSRSGIGKKFFSYNFIIPPGQVPVSDPSLDLVFTNSAFLDTARSGMTILLNGNRVGSIEFPDDNPEPVTAHITLPTTFLRPGSNLIEVVVTLNPKSICDTIGSNDPLWVTIFPESVLHIPLTPATSTFYPLLGLYSFPSPFVNDPSLSSTTFVLPQSDVAAWSVAGTIAYTLGTSATGSVLSFDVDYDGQFEPPTLQDQNLILVGIPSTLSLMNELKDSMPAYFEQDSNIAILDNQQVIYRISSEKSLGYLELFYLPLDKQLVALTVLGTNSEGVRMAGSALITEDIRNTLRGDFATVDGEQAIAVDTLTGLGLGRVSAQAASGEAVLLIAEDESAYTPIPNVALEQTRNNAMLGLEIVGVIMVAVILVAIFLRRRKPKAR